jgi:hypothetical protein
METETYKTYATELTAREEIEIAARRARHEAIREFAVRPLVRFCGSLLRRPTISGARLLPR